MAPNARSAPRLKRPEPPFAEGAVYVIDDDAAVLRALGFALEAEGFTVHLFRSPGELLALPDFAGHGCLLLDFAISPDVDGLDLLAILRERGVTLPAILMTSHASRTVRRRAADASVPVVEKPDVVPAVIDRMERPVGRA